MDSVLLPEDAANHLGAIVLAFNRDASASLLEEAEELVKAGHAAAAVLIAGSVIEYLERSPATTVIPEPHRSELQAIRHVRNQVAHGFVSPDPERVGVIIATLRQALAIYSSGAGSRAQFGAERPPGVKGKYAQVRTSVDEFIRRKREDIDLEDRE